MVLLAERSVAAQERLLRLIRSAGHTVESFAGGPPLLGRLSLVEEPYCVVSDIEVPELDPILAPPGNRLAMADLVGLREAS